MRVLLLAAAAVAISTAAMAKDIKGSVMTDSEMDKVTAGAAADPTTQSGLDTASSVANSHALINANPSPPDGKGLGTGTVPGRP